MKAFNISTQILEYSTLEAYALEAKLNINDLIIASNHTYERYIKPLNIETNVIDPRKYGNSEPTDLMIDELLKETSQYSFNRIIAIGGGAILDMAKLVAVADKEDCVDNLFEKKDTLNKNCELILIPTTCGTGSEVTNISVVNRLSKNTKMGLACDGLYGDKAVLIPQLLETMPHQVFATSSIDALIHSIESYLSPNRSPLSEIFSKEAIATILRCYLKCANGNNWQADASEYLRAATMAGIGFGYAGCAAVHACAYPLGAVHHIPHGQSNQLMLAAVLNKYKQLQPIGRINDLERLIGSILNIEENNALQSLYELLDKILPLKPLREVGVSEDELETYAQSVINQQTRLLNNNYIPLSQDDILDIYKKAY